MEGRYQTATRVKVLSPVIYNIKEVDSFHMLEDSTICIDKAKDRLLFRGLSPWYDIEWKLQELGRALTFFVKNRTKYGQVRDQKSELIEVDIPPILATKNKGYSKAGDFKKKKREFADGVSGNYRGIQRYYFQTIKLVFKWINRRIQNQSFNWDQFKKYLKHYPLPKPKIYHIYIPFMDIEANINEEPCEGFYLLLLEL